MHNAKQILDKVLKSLEREDLSTIPAVLARILAVSRNPHTHAADLAEVCEVDKTISARLLRSANSVYYATGQNVRVDNIKDAIVRVGFNMAEEIIISSKVSSVLKSNTTVGDYSSAQLWKHGVAVGIACRLIFAHKTGKPFMDPFVAGLLHDLGIAMAHQFLFEDGFREVILRRHENQSLLVDEEAAILGITHEQIGEAVARQWNFPDHLVAVLGHHHNFLVENEQSRGLIHIVRLAEYLCFKRNIGFSDFSESHAQELFESREHLKIDDRSLENITANLIKNVDHLANLGWFSELRVKPK